MTDASATWLDGEPAASLPLPDRGLAYGDGLFETLLLHRGRPLLLEYHLERLARGLRTLGFPDCLATAAARIEQAANAVAARGWAWTALRLTLTRGGGPRGYAPPASATPRCLLEATHLQRDCARMAPPAVLTPASVRLGIQPLLAGLKHLNRLEQVLAAAEARRAGADHALLADSEGALVSLCAGNLFLLRDGDLLTPPLDNCGVAGTRRRRLMERWAPDAGLRVRETRLSLDDLFAADEILYTNALYGPRPVGACAGAAWSGHAVCARLFERYLEELA